MNSSGTLIDHIDYGVFGKVSYESNSSNGDRYKFTGRELDSETGWQEHRGRYYIVDIATWASEDPAGFAAGDANLHRYVHNGPTLATDPSGLDDARVGTITRAPATNGTGTSEPMSFGDYVDFRMKTGQMAFMHTADQVFHQARSAGMDLQTAQDAAMMYGDQAMSGYIDIPSPMGRPKDVLDNMTDFFTGMGDTITFRGTAKEKGTQLFS